MQVLATRKEERKKKKRRAPLESELAKLLLFFSRLESIQQGNITFKKNMLPTTTTNEPFRLTFRHMSFFFFLPKKKEERKKKTRTVELAERLLFLQVGIYTTSQHYIQPRRPY